MKKVLYIALSIIILVGLYFVLTSNNNVDQNMTQDQAVTEADAQVQGEVSYAVQKVFFGKPGEEVVGTTTDVSGTVAYVDGILSGDLVVSTDNLSSGADQRDNEVRDWLGTTITARVADYAVTFPFTQSVPVELTINGVTQTVPFELTGEEVEGGLSLQGNATVLMSSFAVEPPSMFEVYSVEDQMVLRVDLMIQQ